MNALEQIRIEALNLPPAERRQLIHELIDSLSARDDVKWEDEIGRRIREVEEGKVECVLHDDVMARARAACK